MYCKVRHNPNVLSHLTLEGNNGQAIALLPRLQGRVNGNIKARHVILSPTAEINGEVTYEMIRISEGAQVNGRMTKVCPAENQPLLAASKA